MTLIRVSLFVGIIALFVASAFADDQQIRIDVTPASANLEAFKTEPPVAGNLSLTAKIKNTSNEPRLLSMMTCSYLDDWSSDNPKIQLEEQSCLSNFPKSVALKPQEIRELPIPLFLTGDIPAGDFHFKLIYHAKKAVIDPTTIPHNLGQASLEGVPFISNDIVIHVTLPSDDRQKYWHAKAKWFEDFHSQDSMVPAKDGVYQRHYFNGQLADERTYKDGQLDGSYKSYFENGQMSDDINYKAGKLDKLSKRYDEKGHLTETSEYSDGQMVSNINYNADGSIHSDMKFMKLEGGKYAHIIPCVEADSDKEVLSMGYQEKCDHPSKGTWSNGVFYHDLTDKTQGKQ